MRKDQRSIPYTQENIKTIRQLVEKGVYLTDIAKQFDVVRDTVRKFLIENKIELPRSVVYAKYKFSEEQIAYIQSLLWRGASLTLVGDLLNLDRSVIGRLVKEYNLSKERDHKYGIFPLAAGEYRKFIRQQLKEGINLETANAKFEELIKPELERAKKMCVHNKSPRFSIPSQKDLDYLLANYKTQNVYELAKALQCDDKKVRSLCRLLGVNIYACTGRIEEPEDPEFQKDLADPSKSAVALGMKYKISDSAIRRMRNEKFGDFKTMVNHWLEKSSAEIKFEQILEELDLAAEYRKKINGWEVDFYLGFKVGVEINSSYHHNCLCTVIDKDKRKLDELKTAGYKILTFWDYELDSSDEIKNQVMQIFIGSLREVIRE